MTEKEELAALRQEIENWKAIATEQGRRLDELAKQQQHIWNIGHKYWVNHSPDPSISITKAMPVWWFEFRKEDDKIFSSVCGLHDRIVKLEKHCFPGIYDKQPPKLTLVALDGRSVTDDDPRD